MNDRKKNAPINKSCRIPYHFFLASRLPRCLWSRLWGAILASGNCAKMTLPGVSDEFLEKYQKSRKFKKLFVTMPASWMPVCAPQRHGTTAPPQCLLAHRMGQGSWKKAGGRPRSWSVEQLQRRPANERAVLSLCFLFFFLQANQNGFSSGEPVGPVGQTAV